VGIAFGDSMGLNLLLIISGPATAIPLLLFAIAARRMRYTTLGLLQYIAPTINFLLAVFAYGETLTTSHIICFALIWTGLAIYSASALAGLRRPAVTEPI
jgi:chloramphenicol-sensitive protein RarD